MTTITFSSTSRLRRSAPLFLLFYPIRIAVYVLPDGYKVSDPSLDDISRVLAPSFTKEAVDALSQPQTAFDLSNAPYTPGFIGLNNIKANDYMNVIIHALLHVPLIRDTLLLSNYTGKEPELLKRFATLSKKLWNSRLFKAQVSPHDFLQEVTRVSAGKFKIMQQGDPVDFLGWLLNTLHKDAGGSKRRNSSMIYSAFQGELRLDTQFVTVKDELSGHMASARPEFDIDREIKSAKSPFLFLAIDLPPPPLFQDAVAKENFIPQSTAGTTRDKANTAWRITLRPPPSDAGKEEEWISIQDLIVKKEQKEMILLGETVLQIWERQDLVRQTPPGGPKVNQAMDVDA
ncbi:hypothetical protein FS842_011043 [Serendipita sp. 407]|nr:hypothetical protein FS842_011043 [Serendipita sp. 407]